MMGLLMLIFAVIEASWAIYSYHYLGHITHEAARYAIVRGGSWGVPCSDTTLSMCTASQGDIADFAASRNFPGINITNVCVEYFSSVPSNTSSCSPPGNTGPNLPGDIVEVTITYPFTLSVPLLPPITWNMSSTSQMVISQ